MIKTSDSGISGIQAFFAISLFSISVAVMPWWFLDPFNLPKLLLITVLIFPGIGFFGPKILHNLDTNRWILFVIAGFFISLLSILILSRRNISEGFYGAPFRNTGFLLFFCLGILFLFGYVTSSSSSNKSLEKVIVILFGFELFYSTLQFLKLDPLPLNTHYENHAIGTLGNPDFNSAFLAMLAIYITAIVLIKRTAPVLKVLGVLLILMTLMVIYSTRAAQGLFAFGIGLLFLVIIYFLKLNFRKISYSMGIAAISTSSLLMLGILGFGPLNSISKIPAITARVDYWQAAICMSKESPFYGLGFDSYVDWFKRCRSLESFKLTPNIITDSSHNVFLDILVNGGLFFLIFYVAMILYASRAIIRMFFIHSDYNYYFVGLSAMWVTFQAQSVISLNQIGLAIWGWGLSGVIIGHEAVVAQRKKKSTEIIQSANLVAKDSRARNISLIGLILGLIVSLMITIPAARSANEFFDAIHTLDGGRIQKAALAKPLDRTRLLQSANAFVTNKYYPQAEKLLKIAIREFPDSLEAWQIYNLIPELSVAKRALIKSELRRLDPLAFRYS